MCPVVQEFPGGCFPVELYNFRFVYDVCAPVGVVFVEPVPFVSPATGADFTRSRRLTRLW